MRSRGQGFGRGRSLTALIAVAFLIVIGAGGVLAQDATPVPDVPATPAPSDSPTPPPAEASPTATPQPETPTPSPTPTLRSTPSPSVAAPVPAPMPPPTDACLDFTSRSEAQAFFEREGGPTADPHGLDPNHDGMACESLQDQVDTADANSDPALGQPPVQDEPVTVPVIPRSPPRNTTKLVDQLQCGLTVSNGIVLGMGRFPVAGRAYYSDDWHKPRYTPTFHLHKGLDIFAAFGTPIRAPAAGRIARLSNSPASGGIGVSMQDDESNWYYFGHLQQRVDGLFVGQRIDPGTVLGYVGDTGNAKGGAPHVHMEIHREGIPIPPKPIVDGWLEEALDGAPECVRSGPDATPEPSATPGPAPVPVSVTPTTTQREPTIIAPVPVSSNSRTDTELVIPLAVLVAGSICVPLLVRRRKRDEYSLIGW